MLETKNIYLDTQVFVSNNYFSNRKLQEIANLANDDQIKLFFTDITLNEIKSNFKEDIERASNFINTTKRDLQNKHKVIKNLKTQASYTSVPTLDVEKSYEEMCSQLQLFIKRSQAIVIPYSKIDLAGVMAKYFKSEHPFGPGKKKSEFPDAIVFSALDAWCRKKKEKIYFVTGDGDFSGLNTTNILVEQSLPELLSKINMQLHKEKYARIENIYRSNILLIEEKIKTAFAYRINDEIGYDITLGKIEFESIDIDNYTITDLNDPLESTIEVTGNILLKIEVTYMDYTFAYYDKEDERYIGGEKSTINLNQEYDFKAEVCIEADLFSDETARDYTISISTINGPNEDDITEELDGYILQI